MDSEPRPRRQYRSMRTNRQADRQHSLIRTPLSDWDANRYVIGIPNGRCAYVTGTWRDGIYGYGIRDQKPEDLIRTKVPHTPTETWHDSVWERLLQRAVLDPETRDWLKSAAGYALCCTGSAKSVLWFKGPKDSGKTSLLEAIAATIGKARAIVMDGDLLSEGKDNRHRTLLAQLAGKSMAWWAEADGWLNQERLKSLSGGDTQTAHFMRCDPFQFRPDLLMVITSNDDLRIRKRDPALYSRIRLVSCFETIPEEDRDPAAVEIARNGSPEVLAWMLEGAAENKEREDAGHSVLPPDTSEMAAAKRDWLARMNAAEVEDEGEGEASKPRRKRKYTIREPPPETIDAVRRFAAECLQVVAVKEMKGQTPASKEDIHVAFTCWAAENDEPTPSSYGFAGIIEQAVEGASYRVWRAGEETQEKDSTSACIRRRSADAFAHPNSLCAHRNDRLVSGSQSAVSTQHGRAQAVSVDYLAPPADDARTAAPVVRAVHPARIRAGRPKPLPRGARGTPPAQDRRAVPAGTRPARPSRAAAGRRRRRPRRRDPRRGPPAPRPRRP